MKFTAPGFLVNPLAGNPGMQEIYTHRIVRKTEKACGIIQKFQQKCYYLTRGFVILPVKPGSVQRFVIIPVTLK